MAQGTQLGAQLDRPIQRDNMTGIIVQTQEHLNAVENKLISLIQRLAPSSEKDPNTARIEPSGMINCTQTLRATASRIVDHCAALDNML